MNLTELLLLLLVWGERSDYSDHYESDRVAPTTLGVGWTLRLFMLVLVHSPWNQKENIHFGFPDEPSEPRELGVTEYWTDFITIAWKIPETDGGSPITRYVIEKRDALRTQWVKVGILWVIIVSYG